MTAWNSAGRTYDPARVPFEGEMKVWLSDLIAGRCRLEQAKTLYARWGSLVSHFCELFLGERSKAEAATVETFVRFLQGGGRAAAEGTPVQLLSCAFQVADHAGAETARTAELLRAAIVRLATTQRAVFILHGTLSVQMPWVAAIIGVTPHEAAQLWCKALLEIRNYLPRDFFKERSR